MFPKRMQILPFPSKAKAFLTLFRREGVGGGGGGILPAATLDVNNFFNIKANATKLGDFFKIYIWQQFFMACHCPRDLTFSF